MSKQKPPKPFYIGWQDEMPPEHRNTLRKFIIPIFIALPILAFAIIYAQKGFNDHQFEFGNLTKLTGVYHSKPVPVLEVTGGGLDADLSNDVLLVGYGKFGAEGILAQIEQSKGSLDGKTISLQGTLIHGDGQTLMELTEEEKSLVDVGDIAPLIAVPSEKTLPVTLTGTILDPKCYFGVMKPGEGKIHKSCAIRCISGGIPPVFRMTSDKGENEYYVLLGAQGETINMEVLDKIAEPVRITGTTNSTSGWNYLYAKVEDIELIEK
ncbi:MAG: hypothetical protein AB8F95_09650 [Bacteroidia bacterium]